MKRYFDALSLTEFPLPYNASYEHYDISKTYSKEKRTEEIGAFITSLERLGCPQNKIKDLYKNGKIIGKKIDTDGTFLYVDVQNSYRKLICDSEAHCFAQSQLIPSNTENNSSQYANDLDPQFKLSLASQNLPKKISKHALPVAKVIHTAIKIFEENKKSYFLQMLKDKTCGLWDIVEAIKNETIKRLQIGSGDVDDHSDRYWSIVMRNLIDEINQWDCIAYNVKNKELYLSILDLQVSEKRGWFNYFNADQDSRVCKLRNDLSHSLILTFVTGYVEYMGLKNKSKALSELKRELKAELVPEKLNDLQQHYLSDEYLIMVLKNILICLTVLGLIALMVKLTYSQMTYGKASGFFDRTPASIKIEKIRSEIDKFSVDDYENFLFRNISL